MTNLEMQVKIVILGSPDVGKSSILRRFILGDSSLDAPNTVGATFMSKIVEFNNRALKLNIWDTAGQERYQSFSKLYCRDAGAAILVYDLSDPESFNGMKKWYDIMSKDILPESALLFIVGNKKDLLEGELNIEEEVKEYCEEIRAQCFKVSAKTGEGVSELFVEIGREHIDKHKKVNKTSVLLSRNPVPVKKNKRFC